MGPRIGSVGERTDKRPASLCGHSTIHLATELLQELGPALVPSEARANVPRGVEGESGQTLEKGGPLVAHPTRPNSPASGMKVCPSGLCPGEA